MGSPVCVGALTPQFLGPQSGGTNVDVSGAGGKTLPVRTEWHSVSVNDSPRPEFEYSFKFVERKDVSNTHPSLLSGSEDVSPQTRKLEVSLCGLSKYVNNDDGDETKPLVSYPDGVKKDCSPYITMEALDSCNGVKEVRVSFHGLEESRKAAAEKILSQSGTHDLGYGDEGCLSLVSQLRAIFSGPKLSYGGLPSGDSTHSLIDGLGTIIHFFKASDSSTIADSKITNAETENLQGQKAAPIVVLQKSSSTGSKDFPKKAAFEARDLQARCDALPLAHYRPDCPVWCSKDQEPKMNGDNLVPNSNGDSAVHMNCKKPPKPPKPPRHPGRSTSLDAATIAAAKAAAARKKALKQAAAKRKARVSAPANSGGTPIIALVLTLGFGMLMVFQGLFVQNTATYGDNEKTFVDVPSDQFGELSVESDNSYGVSFKLESEVQAASQVMDPGEADMLIRSAFYKSMQEIEVSRSSQASYRTAASY